MSIKQIVGINSVFSLFLGICTAGAQSITGYVADSSNARIPEVEVTLMRNGSPLRMARTSSNGQFVFENLEAASFQLSARRLGYHPGTLTARLDSGSNISGLRIVLTPLAVELHQVVAAETEQRLREFNNRKAHGGLARFIDRAEIVKRDPLFLSDMIRRIPGASVRASPTRGFGNIVRIRGCQPTVWIDGKRLRNVEIDEITDPDAVAGLEVYNSSAGVPIEYTDPISNMCGAILIWTRSQ